MLQVMPWTTSPRRTKTFGCGKIHKDQLKGKYITFIDKQGKYRTQKVTKITGLMLTVQDCLGEKCRIHPKKNKILGRQMKREIIPIEWEIAKEAQKHPLKSKIK